MGLQLCKVEAGLKWHSDLSWLGDHMTRESGVLEGRARSQSEETWSPLGIKECGAQ